jgi:hypothetical protein
MFSVSSLVGNGLHFSQETSLHVENEAAHGDVFRDPRMRSDLPDLFQRILVGILVGEKAHGSRRSISGGSTQLCVQLFICEGCEPAAGMVQKQYFCGSQYTGGNNKLTENILGNRGSTGADNVEIAVRQTQDSREV